MTQFTINLTLVPKVFKRIQNLYFNGRLIAVLINPRLCSPNRFTDYTCWVRNACFVAFIKITNLIWVMIITIYDNDEIRLNKNKTWLSSKDNSLKIVYLFIYRFIFVAIFNSICMLFPNIWKVVIILEI